MSALLRMCCKVASRALRKQLLTSLLVIGVLGVLSRGSFIFLYGAMTYIFLSQLVALRIKEKKERWNHFLIALAGYNWRYPSYIYLFSILLSVSILSFGMLVNWLLGMQEFFEFQPANYGSIGALTLGLLFYFQIHLLVSEVIDPERMEITRSLSLIMMFFVVKLTRDWGIDLEALRDMIPFMLGFVCIFSFGLVFLIATYLFRRKYHLA